METHAHEADLGRDGDLRSASSGWSRVQRRWTGHPHPLLVACVAADCGDVCAIGCCGYDILRQAFQRRAVFHFGSTLEKSMSTVLPNKPAPPNAGIASRLTIEHHWPGFGEPER